METGHKRPSETNAPRPESGHDNGPRVPVIVHDADTRAVSICQYSSMDLFNGISHSVWPEVLLSKVKFSKS